MVRSEVFKSHAILFINFMNFCYGKRIKFRDNLKDCVIIASSSENIEANQEAWSEKLLINFPEHSDSNFKNPLNYLYGEKTEKSLEYLIDFPLKKGYFEVSTLEPLYNGFNTQGFMSNLIELSTEGDFGQLYAGLNLVGINLSHLDKDYPLTS